VKRCETKIAGSGTNLPWRQHNLTSDLTLRPSSAPMAQITHVADPGRSRPGRQRDHLFAVHRLDIQRCVRQYQMEVGISTFKSTVLQLVFHSLGIP